MSAAILFEPSPLLRQSQQGSFVGDTVIEEKINALLTITKGIASVNMRWKSVAGHIVLMGAAQSPGEVALEVAKIRSVDGVKSIASHLRIVAKK